MNINKEDYPWVFPDGATEEKQIEALSGRIDEWEYPRPLVFVPLERNLSFADRTLPRFVALGQMGAHFAWIEYGRTDVVRNVAAARFLTTDFTHLIMLDSDQEHPIGNNDIIRRLCRWAIIRPDAEVVGGLNPLRKAPFKPCCYIETKEVDILSAPRDWSPGLMEVKLIGTGSLMIARSVFERLPIPWFYNIYDVASEGSFPGEDIGFSVNCVENGIKLYVDTTTSSPHIGTFSVTLETYREWLKNNTPAVEDVLINYAKIANPITEKVVHPEEKKKK